MNDYENQKKSEKFVDFMSTGVMLLIVTAVAYLLFFAFNYGYNSFFALPVYFSTLLPLRMISETSTLFIAVLFFCNFSIFVMPLRKVIKKILFSPKTIIVLLLLVMIADLIWRRDVWFIIFCFCALVFILWFISSEKKDKERKNIEQQFDDAILDAVFKISRFILFVCLLFNGTVLMGRYDAMKEDSFLFIDEQTVVIDIYESNYISIIVDYDNEINKYVQTGTYVLIPMDNAELRLQKKDGIQISALE